jgi:hypothetical protein
VEEDWAGLARLRGEEKNRRGLGHQEGFGTMAGKKIKLVFPIFLILF